MGAVGIGYGLPVILIGIQANSIFKLSLNTVDFSGSEKTSGRSYEGTEKVDTLLHWIQVYLSFVEFEIQVGL